VNKLSAVSAETIRHTLCHGWRGYALALVAGSLVTLSLAPFNIWPLGIISLALLAMLLDRGSPALAAKTGWFYGLGLFGSGVSWVFVSIHDYGYAPVPLAALLTLIFCAGLALLSAATAYGYTRWLRAGPLGNTVGFAAAVVLGEWLRSWLLTGFPWLYLGYGHIDTVLAGWAPVGGVWAISFIVAYSGAAATAALLGRCQRWGQLAAVLGLWLGGAALNQHQWVNAVDRAPLKVAMIQANISQHEKWSPSAYSRTLATYRDMSAPLWHSHDIVIWPEGAVPNYYQNAKGFLDTIAEQAQNEQSTLITGIPSRRQDPTSPVAKSYNSIMAFGAGSGTYHKQRLVPFGEYIPLEGLLRGLIQFFDMPMSAFSPGSSEQSPLTAGDISLAPFICYEIVYPELVSSWLPAADLLITISNDAWFGHSIGPLQHLEMAQMRALEAGRYLLRSTGSGVSAIIDQRGRIVTQSQQFTTEVLKGQARIYSGTTPIAAQGTWPVILWCLVICLALRLRTWARQ
jgi:apolipoprotein N-acyltransferase